MKLLPLTKGLFALLDDEDFERFAQFKWTATCNPHKDYPDNKKWYAVRGVGKKRVYLHREVNKTRSGHVTDHRCGNGLDNRRENLRNCEHRNNIKFAYTQKGECVCWKLTNVIVESTATVNAETVEPSL